MPIKQINNQAELEEAVNEVFNSIEDTPLIPFGKYKGMEIEDVPNYYLQWILDEDIAKEKSCYNYLLKPVEEELNYRKQFDIFIEN